MLAKRLFDLFFTIPGIIILSPVMILIMLLIKISNPGPVFFRQDRVGKDGKIFRVYKYRTMVVNAEKMGEQITTDKDPRVTGVGHVLRQYKLDELPQLINVLKGEMSLVGPRPEVSEYIDTYTEEERAIVLSVPPGITDYASIEFRDESEMLANSDNVREVYINKILPIKKRYYIQYVKERSVWLDFILILKTFKSIIS
jgi:lipopolysaccharide/colanic/teichoic acid biosynthesis glycosyltransferase